MFDRNRSKGIIAAVAIAASSVVTAPVSADDDFAMQIMAVFSITGQGTVLTGQIESGSVSVGDTVCVPLTNGDTAARRVDTIDVSRETVERAEEGQNVAVLVQLIDKDLVEEEALLHSDCELAETDE